MLAIYCKELKSYFNSMLGYILEAFMMLIGGLYFTSIGLQQGYAEFGYILNSTNFTLLIVIPLLTMRAFAEERRNKTEQLLLTSPVSISEILIGKFLSLVTLLSIPILVYAVYPLVLCTGGDFSLLSAYGCVLCYFLMACACAAIGVFVSNLMENQLLAALCTFCLLLFAYLMGSIQRLFAAGDILSLVILTVILLTAAIAIGRSFRSLTVGFAVFCCGLVLLVGLFRFQSSTLIVVFTSLIEALSLFQPFAVFVSGIFSIKAIIYYLSITVLFLFLTGKSIEKRRWN